MKIAINILASVIMLSMSLMTYAGDNGDDLFSTKVATALGLSTTTDYEHLLNRIEGLEKAVMLSAEETDVLSNRLVTIESSLESNFGVIHEGLAQINNTTINSPRFANQTLVDTNNSSLSVQSGEIQPTLYANQGIQSHTLSFNGSEMAESPQNRDLKVFNQVLSFLGSVAMLAALL